MGSPSEETAGAPPGLRLQPPFPSTSEECLGGTFMHFVSPSQLLAPLQPPTGFPCPVVGGLVLPSVSSLYPLCFHLLPPLGFLLIPIYSIFIKAFDFCNGWAPTSRGSVSGSGERGLVSAAVVRAGWSRLCAEEAQRAGQERASPSS